MTFEGSNDALAQKLVDDRVQGKSYQWIAERHGIPVEEVVAIVRDYLTTGIIRDPVEHRALLQLRLESIIDKLWRGLEKGEFKHGETIINAIKQIQELYDLNEKNLDIKVNVIMDEQATMVFEVLKNQSAQLQARVMELPLTKKAQEALTAWPEWAAESATQAVEAVIYAEEVD